MNYWLLKTEPNSYSWSDMEREKKTAWDGVRNFQARNYLKAMKKGDLAFFYHSGKSREIVGMVRVTKEAFPDPTDSAWTAVEVQWVKPLASPIALAQIKANNNLADMTLVRSSRLSVQPVREEEFHRIMEMSEGT